MIATTKQLMLYRELITVCVQIHTEHISALCEHTLGLLDELGYIENKHWAVKV